MAGYCPGCGNGLVGIERYCSRCGRTVGPVPSGQGSLERWLLPGLIGLVAGLAILAALVFLGRGKEAAPRPAAARPAPAAAAAATPAAPVTPRAARPATRPAGWLGEIRARQGVAPLSHYVIVGGSTPDRAREVFAQAERFRSCSGFAPAVAPSDDFRGLRGGLTVVMLGGFADREFATRVLAWARRCKGDAYLRQATFVGGSN